ncbi:uncharacterized protein LAESUDRAFT_16935 [Laetiporus sulphureus 93-53]|uniref:Vacuolar ATPase assembly integral membrane protein VMA21 n=1 Tax=Laetiporus sulphureus 93-53 TaxID=1314785 RepID=A0A165IAH6_9APHY|nr:uncharacterized protein LAESUDRAFT_16935 [Laetiporus sulphureus 93-53]KZT12806.1 hypothetical protein LAESUDRAFT_16935 [Laetiporus sulphureus 93-53]
MSEQAASTQIADQTASQSGVLAKLLIFSAALAVAPIASYFLSKDYLWDGNTTLAAVTAIVTANVVLVAYIIMSVREERQATLVSPSPPAPLPVESKKER